MFEVFYKHCYYQILLLLHGAIYKIKVTAGKLGKCMQNLLFISYFKELVLINNNKYSQIFKLFQ